MSINYFTSRESILSKNCSFKLAILSSLLVSNSKLSSISSTDIDLSLFISRTSNDLNFIR